VAAIFGPPSPYTHGIVGSIAARFDVPHIEYVWRENEAIKSTPSMTINIFPDSELVSQVSRKKAVNKCDFAKGAGFISISLS